MRDIIFRAWHYGSKRFYVVLNVNFKHGTVTLGDGFHVFVTAKDNVVLEQCTGLKDKNGNMIFEGDIVSMNHDNFSNDIDNPQPYVKWVGEVKWHKTGYSVFQNNDSYKPRLSNIRIIDIEIIGNIHEVQND